MTTELKPCPNPKCTFGQKHVSYRHELDGGTYVFWVECKCGVRGPKKSCSSASSGLLWNDLPREAEPVEPEDATGISAVDKLVEEHERVLSSIVRLTDALTRRRLREEKAEPVEPERTCPHCSFSVGWVWVSDSRYFAYCQRGSCHARGPDRPTEQEAYAAWWEPFKNSCVRLMCDLRTTTAELEEQHRASMLAAGFKPAEDPDTKSECLPQSQEEDHLCPWCRQKCRITGRWYWQCETCYMSGPLCKSDRAATRSLERMNKRQVQR